MCRGVELGTQSKPINPDELLHVLLVRIGVFLLTEGLPSLGWLAYTIIEHIRQGTTEPISYTATTFSGLVRVALGGWLVLRPYGAVELINRYSRKTREQGTANSKEQPLA